MRIRSPQHAQRSRRRKTIWRACRTNVVRRSSRSPGWKWQSLKPNWSACWLERDRAEAAIAHARVEEARAALQQAELALERATLRAPIPEWSQRSISAPVKSQTPISLPPGWLMCAMARRTTNLSELM
jgi:hypothetical protein